MIPLCVPIATQVSPSPLRLCQSTVMFETGNIVFLPVASRPEGPPREEVPILLTMSHPRYELLFCEHTITPLQ